MVAVGFDFGTTYSTLSVHFGTHVATLQLDGSEFVPTLLALRRDGTYAFGSAVSDLNPKQHSVFRDLKRWIGVTSLTVGAYKKKLKPAYEVSVTGDVFSPRITSSDGQLTLSLLELVATFMRLCLLTFSDQLSLQIDDICVSVPAQYTTSQRLFMKSAEQLTGFKTVHIMNEPSAALYASVGLVAKSGFSYYIVFDFGGGTFDVSVVGRHNDCFAVLYSQGDLFLGGRDIDAAIAEYAKKTFSIELTIKESQELKERVSLLKTSYTVKGFTLSYDYLKIICQPFYERAVATTLACYRNSGLSSSAFLVPIGGSVSLPGLLDFLSNHSSLRFVSHIITYKAFRSAVSEGCALFRYAIGKTGRLFVDVLTSGLFINSTTFDIEPILLPGTAVPVVASHRVSQDLDRNSRTYFTKLLYEGVAFRAHDNDLLTKFTIKPEDFGLSAGMWLTDITVSVSSMGLLSITATATTGNRRVLTFSREAPPGLRLLSRVTAPRVARVDLKISESAISNYVFSLCGSPRQLSWPFNYQAYKGDERLRSALKSRGIGLASLDLYLQSAPAPFYSGLIPATPYSYRPT